VGGGLGQLDQFVRPFKIECGRACICMPSKPFTITERDRKWKPDLPVENKNTYYTILPLGKDKIFIYAQKI
jgi:hypothetical protein